MNISLRPSPSAHGAPRRQRMRGGCVALVVAGHIGALGLLLHGDLPRPPGVGDAVGRATGRVAIVLREVPIGTTSRSAERRSAAAKWNATQVAAPGRLAPDAPRAFAETLAAPAARPAKAKGTPAPAPEPARAALSQSLPSPQSASLSDPVAPVARAAHFYTFDEVELPATPASDWDLDAATLDGARIDRLVFDLFVSDQGVVVGCVIVEPPMLEDDLRASLETRLRSTVLLPAVRTGRAVDSVRRIELTVS